MMLWLIGVYNLYEAGNRSVYFVLLGFLLAVID